ncbi:uncharacterized protein LOC135159960 [Diachasmimorpha longicaudata]|uniref:uncharacterized protein LOC135159960 n=1 Tax=Diachasmimorpha longicaudata TaxID=58733 RepID=UPI0030B8D530
MFITLRKSQCDKRTFYFPPSCLLNIFHIEVYRAIQGEKNGELIVLDGDSFQVLCSRIVKDREIGVQKDVKNEWSWLRAT